MSKLIAVYGTLRLDEGNWRWYLNNDQSKHLGTTKVDNNFTLVDYTGGGFPAIVHHPEGNTPVVVDVFEVTEEIAQRVDRLEGYDESRGGYQGFYDRMTVETEFGDADIYFMKEDALNRPKIDSGDWVKYLEENYRNVKVE